jgi:ubiquinol-cytochrome c reductase iron-sulfur subunit
MSEDRSREDELSGRKQKHASAFELLVTMSVLGWEAFRSVARILARKSSGETSSTVLSHPEPLLLDRAADKAGTPSGRDLDLETPESAHRADWGTLLVALAFAASVTAGVGFLIFYWSGGGNMLLGGTLALCLGFFGAALVLSARWLMRHREAVEPREDFSSSDTEREAAFEDYCAGAREVRSRALLKWMAAVGLGMFATMFVSLMRGLGSPSGQSLFDTVWKRGQRLMTADGKPVTSNSLQPGDSITVFPEDSIGSEKAQTVLIRVNAQLLRLPGDRSDWAPMGYLAYSRVCTHAGCPVGLYEAESHLLLCPCHQSTFNVLDAAQPTGGPAARPLPQLPLYADADGNLRAGSGFSEPPGPGFWEMP